MEPQVIVKPLPNGRVTVDEIVESFACLFCEVEGYWRSWASLWALTFRSDGIEPGSPRDSANICSRVSSFNTGKYAVRALSSSLAKEFGPQGVHVGHAIIDGVIDIPRTKEWLKDAGPDAKISPDGVS